MDSQARDELLVRVDERVKSLHDWTIEHKQVHKDEKDRVRRWLYPIYAATVGLVIKTLFYN